jgi:CDGSH-type Zn-finger protein
MSGARIEFEPNGPLIVFGPATIVDADGNEKQVEAGHSVRLCRCGHSGTKPFCDSTHHVVDFVSRPHFEPERR